MPKKKLNNNQTVNVSNENDRTLRQTALNLWVNEWTRKRNKNICKPCWEINYCPYGPMVEEFPLLPLTRKEAKEYKDHLIHQIESGFFNNDPRKKKEIQREICQFNPTEYPLRINQNLKDQACSIFGHLCPVFFVSEPFTETGKLRNVTRHVPRSVLIRVVRRNNSTCQACGKHY